MSIGLRLSLAVLFLVQGKINVAISPSWTTIHWYDANGLCYC